MRRLRKSLVLLLPLAMSGCAIFGGATPTADTYDLRVPQAAESSPVRRGVQVLVAEPVALKAFDSQNVVVQTSALTIRYLDESQWSDRLPKLVQVRIAQALQDSGRFTGVGLPGQGLAIDFQIVSEIRSFGIDADTNTAEVSMAVKILNDRNGVVASERLFKSTTRAGGVSNEDYIAAIDRAFRAVSDDVVVWVTSRI